MSFAVAAPLFVKPLAFLAASLPIVIENLRTGHIPNISNAALLAGGLGVMALGPTLGMAGFDLPSPSPWMLAALAPLGMYALKMIRGGAAKLLIALLPWFPPSEYLFVVAIGFFFAGAAGLALKRKDVQIATPMLALGLVLQVAGAALRHP